MIPDAATRHGRILYALKAYHLRFGLHWVSNGDLMQPTVGGGDWRRRVFELRERGHVIIMKRDAADPHLTFWTWLGVEVGSEASKVEVDAWRDHSVYVHTVWKQRYELPNEPHRTVWRYQTKDGFTAYVEEVKTAGGGHMLVELKSGLSYSHTSL